MTGKIIRFVFEGCPSSGKSAAVRFLKSLSAQIPVVFVSEVATGILEKDPDFVRRDQLAFQKEVLDTQYAREYEASLQCQNHADAPLIVEILDRGAADAFVYLNEENAVLISQTTADALLSRYDIVFHFDPYIKGASIKDGNDLRAESNTEELLDLHRKSLAVWGRHTHVETVPVFDSKEKKGVYVASRINVLAGMTVFVLPE